MKNFTMTNESQRPSTEKFGYFNITLEGENIIDVIMDMRYTYFGLEKACEAKTYEQNVFLIERAQGVYSHALSTAYCQAVETLAGVHISRRAAYIRVIVAELERMHSHFLWISMLGRAIGFDALFMHASVHCEQLLECLCSLSGNRIIHSVNTLGGVRRDIATAQAENIIGLLNKLEAQISYYESLLLHDLFVSSRLRGVGALKKEDVFELGLSGVFARCTGVNRDIRSVETYAAYGEIPFTPSIGDSGDALCRAELRLAEIRESISIIRYALDNLPEGDLVEKMPVVIPAGEVISRVEDPRGESSCYIRSLGEACPDRLRLLEADKAHWPCLKYLLQAGSLTDMPVIIADIDPWLINTARSISFSTKAESSAMVDSCEQSR